METRYSQNSQNLLPQCLQSKKTSFVKMQQNYGKELGIVNRKPICGYGNKTIGNMQKR